LILERKIKTASRSAYWNLGLPGRFTAMMHQSDPNTNRRNDISDDNVYTSWIISGAVVLAIVIAVFAFISTGSMID
jgi:hypothetical protein